MLQAINPFRGRSHPETAWFSVGRASSFAEAGLDENEPRLCGRSPGAGDADTAANPPTCKVFHVPKTDASQRTEVEVRPDDMPQDMTDQVLVFRYRGKIHAIDHQCPHSSFPLSQGIPFDIEDFGIVLSAGLTCPKHGWSFDLFSGWADRGNYKLKIWEVQLREIPGDETDDREVWVRRKPRIG